MPGLEPKLRGGIYYAIGSVAGQRIRKSLGTRQRGQAEELCAQLEARLWKRHSYGEEAVRTFDEAALAYMKGGGERRFLAPLIKRFRGRVLGSIKPGEIRDAARELYPGAKASTRNRQGIVPAVAVINDGASRGWCPAIAVERFPTTKPQRIAVGRSWIDAFMAQADRDDLPHLAAGVLFMWQNGPRVSEVVAVLAKRFDADAKTIVLAKTKESEWQVCHLSRELTARVANLKADSDERLFGYSNRWGFGKRMKAVCRRAGISFVPPHQAGRHSFATNAFAMGVRPKEVMEGGRWKTMRMVIEIYDHANEAGRTIANLFDANRAQKKPKLRQVSGKKREK